MRATIVYGRRREGVRISTSVSTTASPDASPFEAGVTPGAGTFFCVDCGSQLSLQETDALPECPRCGAADFRRDSIFESMQEHGDTAEFALPHPQEAPAWLSEARTLVPDPGPYLALREDADDEIQVFPIGEGWTRIGRSVTADIRLDDPSVSRRHALIVSEEPDTLRVLDDRSLNGVFLNGDVVEWARLADGDELTIGRYCLFALEA